MEVKEKARTFPQLSCSLSCSGCRSLDSGSAAASLQTGQSVGIGEGLETGGRIGGHYGYGGFSITVPQSLVSFHAFLSTLLWIELCHTHTPPITISKS